MSAMGHEQTSRHVRYSPQSGHSSARLHVSLVPIADIHSGTFVPPCPHQCPRCPRAMGHLHLRLRSASGLRQNRLRQNRLRQNRLRQKRLRRLSRETINAPRVRAAGWPLRHSLPSTPDASQSDKGGLSCLARQQSHLPQRHLRSVLPRLRPPWPTTLLALKTLQERDVLARSSKMRRRLAIGARNTIHAARPIITVSRG